MSAMVAPVVEIMNKIGSVSGAWWLRCFVMMCCGGISSELINTTFR